MKVKSICSLDAPKSRRLFVDKESRVEGISLIATLKDIVCLRDSLADVLAEHRDCEGDNQVTRLDLLSSLSQISILWPKESCEDKKDPAASWMEWNYNPILKRYQEGLDSIDKSKADRIKTLLCNGLDIEEIRHPTEKANIASLSSNDVYRFDLPSGAGVYIYIIFVGDLNIAQVSFRNVCIAIAVTPDCDTGKMNCWSSWDASPRPFILPQDMWAQLNFEKAGKGDGSLVSLEEIGFLVQKAAGRYSFWSVDGTRMDTVPRYQGIRRMETLESFLLAMECAFIVDPQHSTSKNGDIYDTQQ